MFLSNILYLYIFLPVFMGFYAVTPPKIRPLLISAANLLFLLTHGLTGLFVFIISFSAAYFSAIGIYNARKDGKKSGVRRFLLTINILLNAVLFFMFVRLREPAAFPDGAYSANAVFGAAVVALHSISYVFDVYRGDAPAQTAVFPLAAFISFFPSLGFGPVLKYKNFAKTFEAPAISSEKAASGIRIYVFGLAEYVLIAQQLGKVRDTIVAAAPERLGGISLWLSALVFYVTFFVGIMGMVHMGRGTAIMLGFPIKPCFRRSLRRSTVFEQIYTFNIPLNSWVKDYVYSPLNASGLAGNNFSMAAAVLIAALWYSISPSWLAYALLLILLLSFEKYIGEKSDRIPVFIRLLASRLAAACSFFIGAFIALFSGTYIRNAFSLLFSTAASENSFLEMLIRLSAPLTALGLMVIGSVMPVFLRKIDLIWFRAALPVIELLLIMLSTAFMISG